MVTFSEVEELRQQIEPEIEQLTGYPIMSSSQRLLQLVLAFQVANIADINQQLLIDLIVTSGWSAMRDPRGDTEQWIIAEYQGAANGSERTESSSAPLARHLLGYCPVHETKIPRRERVPGSACPFCGHALPRSGQSYEIGAPTSEEGSTLGDPDQTDGTTFHVIYLGGFEGHVPHGGALRQSWHESWVLVLGMNGVEIRKKENKLLAKQFAAWASWEELKFVAFEDAGTRPDVVALALFGMLGLGSRKAATLITIGYPDGEAMFLSQAPLFYFRQFARATTQSHPEIGKKVHIGAIPGDEASAGAQDDGGVVDQLERAAGLLERGLITEDDYDRIKADLIDGL